MLECSVLFQIICYIGTHDQSTSLFLVSVQPVGCGLALAIDYYRGKGWGGAQRREANTFPRHNKYITFSNMSKT